MGKRPAKRAKQLKIEPKRQNHSRVGPPRVEYVGCEIHLLVRETDQDPALNVEAGLVSLCPLRHETHPTPVPGRVAQFRPAVKKVTRTVPGIEYEFALRGKVQPLPVDSRQVPRSNACCVTENATYHRSGPEDQFLARLKVITDPQGASLLVLVVVSRSEMKMAAIGRECRRRIGSLMGHYVACDVEGKGPLVAGGVRCRARRLAIR